ETAGLLSETAGLLSETEPLLSDAGLFAGPLPPLRPPADDLPGALPVPLAADAGLPVRELDVLPLAALPAALVPDGLVVPEDVPAPDGFAGPDRFAVPDGLLPVGPVSPDAAAGLPAPPPIGMLPSGPIAAAPTGYLRSSTYC